MSLKSAFEMLKGVIFIAKINQDIENLELPIDVKTKYIKVLRTMTNTENVEEIKTQLFYGIQITPTGKKNETNFL